MPYFAEINPETADPKQVLGWYDTGFATYVNMPSADRLIEMTAAQWASRDTTPLVSAGAFVAGPPPARFVPGTVTNFQCRAVLMRHGLFDQVDTMVRALGGVAFQAWEYANDVSRNGPLVLSLASALGFTAEQTDDLFIEAWEIVA